MSEKLMFYIFLTLGLAYYLEDKGNCASEMHFASYRFYDPKCARFLQSDTFTPHLSNQGLNRLTYVNNNPFKNIDPTGHVPQDISKSSSDIQPQPSDTQFVDKTINLALDVADIFADSLEFGLSSLIPEKTSESYDLKDALFFGLGMISSGGGIGDDLARHVGRGGKKVGFIDPSTLSGGDAARHISDRAYRKAVKDNQKLYLKNLKNLRGQQKMVANRLAQRRASRIKRRDRILGDLKDLQDILGEAIDSGKTGTVDISHHSFHAVAVRRAQALWTDSGHASNFHVNFSRFHFLSPKQARRSFSFQHFDKKGNVVLSIDGYEAYRGVDYRRLRLRLARETGDAHVPLPDTWGQKSSRPRKQRQKKKKQDSTD